MKIEIINYLIEFTSIVVKMGLSWHVWCINKNVVQNKRNRELWLANPLPVRHFFYKSLYTSTIASDLFSPSILQIFLKQSSTSECRYRARRGRKKLKHWPRYKLLNVHFWDIKIIYLKKTHRTFITFQKFI